MNIYETLEKLLIDDYKVAPGSLKPHAHLSTLGVDSLGFLELMFKIEDTFHLKLPDDPPTNLVTVQDVCSYIEGLVLNSAVKA